MRGLRRLGSGAEFIVRLAISPSKITFVRSRWFDLLSLFVVILRPFLIVAYLTWLGITGGSNFSSHGVGHALLFTTTGVITAVPLICFGAAATRVSMVTLGLLQYLAPTIQFVLGLLVFDEEMSPGRWIGFTLVWGALVVFTTEALRHRRRQLALAAEATAAA